MAVKIEMLRYFRTVVDEGSLADAAMTLGRTPSAVSMMLKQFEEHIGAPLFESARKSRLTPLGEAIYAEARRELEHFDRTLEVIESLAKAEMGLVRVVATPSISMAVLPRIMESFLAQHPKVKVELRDMDSISVQKALENDNADIGLGNVAHSPMLDCRPLLSDRYGVVCCAGHPLSEDWDSLTWADLGKFEFIANGLCDEIRDPEFEPILAASRVYAPNTASLLGMVRAGVGVTLLPQLVAKTDDRGLTFLPLRDVTARRSVSLATQPQHMLTPAARAFVASIETARQAGLGLQLD